MAQVRVGEDWKSVKTKTNCRIRGKSLNKRTQTKTVFFFVFFLRNCNGASRDRIQGFLAVLVSIIWGKRQILELPKEYCYIAYIMPLLFMKRVNIYAAITFLCNAARNRQVCTPTWDFARSFSLWVCKVNVGFSFMKSFAFLIDS